MTVAGMRRSMLAYALAFTAADARAACPRDPLYPAAVPWIPCPTLVMPSPCHWCPKGDVHIDATYDGVGGADLAKKVTAALGRPWTIDSDTAIQGGANLVAHDPHHHLWIRITATAKGSTMHVELSPR